MRLGPIGGRSIRLKTIFRVGLKSNKGPVVSEQIAIDILFFGLFRDIVGLPHVRINVAESCRAEEILSLVKTRFPKIKGHKLLVAVNEEYADADTLLKDGDEVAIFTAVSGG